jgi:hypothetical protein
MTEPPPTPKPAEPKPEAKPEAKPETKAAPPAPSTQPAVTHGKYDQYATKNPDGSPPSKNQPTGKLLLGRKDDPVAGKIWGQDAAPAPFDHSTHVQPKYAANCEVCHHTNTDSKTEGVLRCVACHKESGNEKNPINEETGDEIDVKLAYHGSPDNEKIQAGCITCHKKRNVEPTSCAGCHSGTASLERSGRPLALMAIAHRPWDPDAASWRRGFGTWLVARLEFPAP